MSTIRRLYDDVTHIRRGGVTHDVTVSAVTGFALGLARSKMSMDRRGVPVDALVGAAVKYAGSFGPLAARRYLGGNTVQEVATAAIVVGMAEVGKHGIGKARAHGEFSMGSERSNLVEAASEL